MSTSPTGLASRPLRRASKSSSLVYTVEEPIPPSVAELVAAGFERDAIEGATRAGALVRLSPELVMTPAFVERAERIVREAGAAGVTVSAFRESLGTSRRFALPLLEHLDARGITKREGDIRVARGTVSATAGDP